MKRQQTLTQSKMKFEIREVYQILLKYGYPALVNRKIQQDIQNYEKILSEYINPTPKRQNILEWLITQLHPMYQHDVEFKNNKKKKIMNYLWKLGVLPFSKHTKNLDYQKYIEGLLGYENSVNLLYNLCLLLKQSNQYLKSKQDNKFGQFYNQLIKNYEELINIDYDPYKISFPSSYQQLTQEQFQIKYQQTLQLINQLKNKQKNEIISDYQTIFKQFEQNKQIFKQMYSILIQKIDKITKNNNYLIQHEKFNQHNQHGKILKISQNLPKIYRQYKQKIKIIQYQTSFLIKQKQQIKNIINSINQQLQL